MVQRFFLCFAVITGVGSVCSAALPKPSKHSAMDGTPSHVGHVDGRFLDSLPTKELEYVIETYLDPSSNGEKNYQIVYGHPEKARIVLMIWTSLGCPTCSEIYKTLIEPLKAIASSDGTSTNTPDDFALIVRDYPHTPTSLTASAMVWACAPHDVHSLMHRLHHDLHWIATSDESLDILEKQVGEHYPQHLKAVQKARHDNPSKETIFQGRAGDKAALRLTKVPTVVLLEKKNAVWAGWRSDDPDAEKLKQSIFPALMPKRHDSR